MTRAAGELATLISVLRWVGDPYRLPGATGDQQRGPASSKEEIWRARDYAELEEGCRHVCKEPL